MAIAIPESLAKVLESQPIPQQAFPWKLASWLNKMHDLPEVVERLELLPRKLDRSTVRDVVRRELAAERVLPAFVTAMVWGYGNRGYGPSRVRWVLTGVKAGAPAVPVRDDISDLLRSAVETVRMEGVTCEVSGHR